MIVVYVLGFLAALILAYLIFLGVCSLFIDPRKEYETNSRFYRFLLYSATAASLRLLRIKVHTTGLEKIPEGKKLLFVGNHRSNFDPIIEWQVLKKWELAFISKEANFKIPFFGRFIRKCCFLAIDRNNPRNALGTIEKASELLQKGEVCVGVYPEGTRNRTEELLPFHNGVFRIAKKAEAPVVVMAIKGTEKIHKNVLRRRSDIYLDIADLIPAEEVKIMKTAEIGKRVKNALEVKLSDKESCIAGVRYILYNPYAGNGRCKDEAKRLADVYDNAVIINMSRINSYKIFFEGLEPDAVVIICGGDGTLNRFVNDAKGAAVNNLVFYFAAGTENNFALDLGHTLHDAPDYRIDLYIKNLPSVTVNGEKRFFINGVGYGIDSYCCEIGDKLRRKKEVKHKNKPINYKAVAAKGLLFHFKPRNVKVTVDGVKYTYKNVWFAPTMNGRFYGGGLMPAPQQDRENAEHKVSLIVFHGCGRLRALRILPSVVRGKHMKYKKQVSVLEGKEITVEFDRPAPLEIDGDTVFAAASYAVSTQ